MTDPPSTRPSLLVRIRDARDGQAWSQFVEIYAPLVYGFARKHGLQDADAADLTQDVLRAVSGAIGRLDYDPRQGSFRGWLFTIVRNKLRNFLATRQHQCQGTGDTDALHRLEQHPDSGEDQWAEDYERRLFAWAAERVRGAVQETTWQAFWRTAVEGAPAAQVAEGLGLSVGAVYIAKSRVLARLREQVQELESE